MGTDEEMLCLNFATGNWSLHPALNFNEQIVLNKQHHNGC